MSEAKLGSIPGLLDQRDAVHVAVIPCVAGRAFSSGEHVAVIDGKAVDSDKPHGIIDPFLREVVCAGDRVWVCLYPGSVVGMRHHWLHPDFMDASQIRDKALIVLSDYAHRARLTVECMIDDATNFIESNGEDWRCDGGRFEGVYCGDDFWDAYEIATGRKVASNDRGGVYTCSC